MISFIVGKRSLLSKNLNLNLKNSKIISTNEFIDLKLKNKANIIINSFYPSFKINKILNYENFFYESIIKISKALDKINTRKINKIIYTSSSSVYGYGENINQFDSGNRKLYSISKLAAENLIINFCKKHKIKFNVARVFNIYGKNDNFSIISKLIKSYKKKEVFILNNNGSAVRDFISYNQVSVIYKKLLNSNKSAIIDVGTGFGIQIKDLIKQTLPKDFVLKNKNLNELSYSVSEKNEFNKKLNNNHLVKFLKKELKIKKKISFSRYKNGKNYLYNNFINQTIIYGAGNAGQQLDRLLSQKNLNSVYCFVDDDRNKQKKIINNKKVISFENLKKISSSQIISSIIISIPSLSSKKLEKLLIKLKPYALNINYLPLKNYLSSDKITIDDVNYSELKELFERKISKIDRRLTSKLKNKTILVTGGAGSIGQALCNKLKGLEIKKIIALDKSEMGIYDGQNKFSTEKIEYILGDITDKNFLKYIDKKYKIDLVFHAAAFKHLNILEKNIYHAVLNNIFGTLNIIDIFNKQNIVVISTDKAAKPKSVLGMTKRISEIISINYLKNNHKINVVRFGNVFASQGSAINLFLNQINYGGPVTITNRNVKRFFMSSSEAADLVIQGSQLKLNKKILILKMGKQIKLLNIINKLVELKRKKNPFFNIKIKEIGLRKGEKLSETLTINKTSKMKQHKDIYISNEPTYKFNDVKQTLHDLKKSLLKNDEKSLLRIMKNFLADEISN